MGFGAAMAAFLPLPGAGTTLRPLLAALLLLLTFIAPARATEATHVLVVGAPTVADPRYRRMLLQFSAIEAVWRKAGVAFVGAAGGVPSDVMGALPPGISAASAAHAVPRDGRFAVRLLTASGRIAHASDAEVPRAVLLALVDVGDRSARVVPAAPASHAVTLPRFAPPPAWRPAPPASVAVAEPVPEESPTTLDWAEPEAPVAATPPPEREPGPALAARAPAASPPPRIELAPHDGATAGAVAAVAPVEEDAATASAAPSAWRMWRMSGDGGEAVTDAEPARPLDPVPTGALPSPSAGLSAALPEAVVARVRDEAIDRRFAEARRHDGFEVNMVPPDLPLAAQVAMRFAQPPSAALDGPDLGLALLVTGSCGAATPEPRRRSFFFGR